MTELIIGNGFFARNYAERAAELGYDTHQAGRHPEDVKHPNAHYLDMLDRDSIAAVLDEVQPDVIINCAAILGRKNDRELLDQNPIFAGNLLGCVKESGLNPRVIMIGSSATYGPVEADQLPVHETAALKPLTGDLYGRSKMIESEVAHRLADEHRLDVVEARVFNPLGPGMYGSNIITAVMGQVAKIRSGVQEPIISVRNTEVQRDYFHIKDLMQAFDLVAHAKDLDHRVYNVGSGIATSNEALITSVLHQAGMEGVSIQATDTNAEPLVGAVQADNSRLAALGWRPHYSFDETIAEMVAEFDLRTATSHAA